MCCAEGSGDSAGGGDSALKSLAVARGVGWCGLQEIGESADGEGRKFGGLNAGTGACCALDEGELMLDVRELEPLGDGDDFDVVFGGNFGKREIGTQERAEECGLGDVRWQWREGERRNGRGS